MRQLTIFQVLVFTAISYPTNAHTSDFGVQLKELCSFNYLEWKATPSNLFYSPIACVPRAIEKVDNRMFISTPRRPGVPATLSVFHDEEICDGKCPKLTAYPSVELNDALSVGDSLVNVQGFTVDRCHKGRRLWLIDSGAHELKNQVLCVKEPALVIIDTCKNTIIRRRVIPSKFYSTKYVMGFSNVVVNVLPCADCSNTFAYIVNHLEGTLTVYSYIDDSFWQFYSTLFKMNAYPDSLFKVKTLNGTEAEYQLDANLWHVSVDTANQKLIFGARSSKHAFTIPLSIVHNQKSSTLPKEKYDIKYLGEYNPRGQVAAFELFTETQTVFGIQEQNYGIFCWNYQKPLTPTVVRLVAGCQDLVPFLVDMIVDHCPHDPHLIVLSNNLAGIVNDDFCLENKNFRIFTASVRDILSIYPECTNSLRFYHKHSDNSL